MFLNMNPMAQALCGHGLDCAMVDVSQLLVPELQFGGVGRFFAVGKLVGVLLRLGVFRMGRGRGLFGLKQVLSLVRNDDDGCGCAAEL